MTTASARVVVLICVGLPSLAAAQPGRGAVAAGNRLYDEGRYEEAHEQYLEALRQAPDSTIVPFNDGNALYRTEELQRAMESYRQAIEHGNPAVEAQAWYNLGNALYTQQQFEPALEAYKEALRRNPADTDAKHNFEMALEQLEQQQQQQPSDDQQDENDERQDQQDGQPSEQAEQQEQAQPPDQEPQDQPEDQGPQDQEPQQENVERPPPPGALSREEAERLLQAIDEDPNQIQRQRQTTAPARPPRRPW